MSNVRFKVIPLEYAICPQGENPVFGDGVTRVRVDDEAAGGFLVIEQNGMGDIEQKPGQIKMDDDELEVFYRISKKLLHDYRQATDAG